jgi:hypothetical protein
LTTLDTAVERILDAIRDAIVAASNETGGGLDEVASVVLGDRARPMPDLPAVWVIPQVAQYEQTEYGDSETWTLDVSIAALVSSDDPEEGAAKARTLAARARGAALTIRGSLDELVDVTSRTYDPHPRRSEENRNLHWTDATVRVTFEATPD